MEDPIKFDVYGKVDPMKRNDAVTFLESENVYSRETDVRKAFLKLSRKFHPDYGYEQLLEIYTAYISL